jgi:hypothetical protein
MFVSDKGAHLIEKVLGGTQEKRIRAKLQFCKTKKP